MVMVLVFLQIATRRDLLGWLAWILFATWMSGGLQDGPALIWAPLLTVALIAVLLLRAGIAGLAIAITVNYIFNDECHTIRLDAWYANVTLAALFTVAILVASGFVAATRTRRRAQPEGA